MPAIVRPQTPRQEVSAYDLAGTYLRALGAPDTPSNRNVMAAWFWMESAHGSKPGTIIVIGNNPLNIKGVGSLGQRNTSQASGFAVFATPEEGAVYWKNLITARSTAKYGYNDIAGALISNSNKPEPALAAIVNSAWVTGKTGGYSYSNGRLQSAYSYLSGKAVGSTTGTNSDVLFGIQFGTVLTPSVINAAIQHLKSTGLTDAHIPIVGAFISANAETTIANTLAKHMGEQWSPTLAVQISKELGLAATEANPANTYLQPLTTIAGAAGAIVNPTNWQYILAILAGGALIVMGGFLIVKEGLFTEAPTNVRQTPIVVRES